MPPAGDMAAPGAGSSNSSDFVRLKQFLRVKCVLHTHCGPAKMPRLTVLDYLQVRKLYKYAQLVYASENVILLC